MVRRAHSQFVVIAFVPVAVDGNAAVVRYPRNKVLQLNYYDERCTILSL